MQPVSSQRDTEWRRWFRRQGLSALLNSGWTVLMMLKSKGFTSFIFSARHRSPLAESLTSESSPLLLLLHLLLTAVMPHITPEPLIYSTYFFIYLLACDAQMRNKVRRRSVTEVLAA